jgi:hypothetical protein
MRHPDWQLRYEALMAQRARTPFAWGVNDCVLFAADCTQALTGQDHAAAHRGYASAREALVAVKAAGGLHAIATAALGPAVSPLMAGVGDVCLVQVGRRQALGVCNGTTVLGPSPAGLVAVPLDRAVAAWKV